MSKKEAERHIRSQKGNTDSVDEQVIIAHAMWDEGIAPPRGGVKKAELEDQLGIVLKYNPGTSLDHLEEASMVESYTPPGPDGYAINERLDEIVNGRTGEVAEEDIEALIQHIHDDDPNPGQQADVATDGSRSTVRSVIADAFDLRPQAVEGFLRTGDQVLKLNTAIQAMEDKGLPTRSSYGSIIFRNAAYRWQLNGTATGLYDT